MKKLLFSLSMLALTASFTAKAGVGDTTWVQANIATPRHYGNYDTIVSFPDGSKTYRQVLEIFTLGETNCPSGDQYCHQWDYTVTNYVMTRGGDTAEISRFITPFATTGTPRYPSTWKRQYIFDVTDYYTLLKDSATIRMNYSGYSWGFTVNVKYAFIEGAPPRNVLGVQHLWTGYYSYGNTADPISNHVTPQTLTVPVNTVSSELKFTVTGHGADATDNCCEFTNSGQYHSYSVMLNNNSVATKLIYKGCGLNEWYPQGGTWLYDRGNWCTGDAVNINTHPLASASTGSTLGVNFSAYTGSGSYGGFDVNGEVVYYGNFNHTVDASLVEIIAPNNDPNHFRENPTASNPVVHVRNTGSSTITSIVFNYNVQDSATVTYTWNGSLPALQDSIITLPTLSALANMSLGSQSGIFQFNVQIASVNGSADQDASNNKVQSTFVVAPEWPNKFVVAMKTNSEGVSGIGVSPSETSWQITDMNNNVVASRTNADVSKLYNDSIWIGNSGVYKLTITDLGCDGLQWFVWTQNPSYGVTAGSFTIKKLPGSTSIPMNGYNYTGEFNNDFGCGFTQYFTTKGSALGIQSIAAKPIGMDVYPNPVGEGKQLWMRTDLPNSTKATLYIYDILGRVVVTQPLELLENNGPIALNVQQLKSGMYQAVLQTGDQRTTQKFTISK